MWVIEAIKFYHRIVFSLNSSTDTDYVLSLDAYIVEESEFKRVSLPFWIFINPDIECQVPLLDCGTVRMWFVPFSSKGNSSHLKPLPKVSYLVWVNIRQ